MNTQVMFSSANEVWATPQDFFDKLNEEFQFTLDPCATADNHKCARFFTVQDDGLKQDWGGGTRCSAIPRMDVTSLAHGLRKPTKKAASLIRWLCAYFRPGLIRSGSTTSFWVRLKYGL